MKIKQKRQVNLPELIEWAWENEIKNKTFELNHGAAFIKFNKFGHFTVPSKSDYNAYFKPSMTFEIEEEIEIDKDTVLDKAIEMYVFASMKEDVIMHRHKSISQIFNRPSENFRTTHIHYVNPDGTMTLIWKDGEMVD